MLHAYVDICSAFRCASAQARDRPLCAAAAADAAGGGAVLFLLLLLPPGSKRLGIYYEHERAHFV